MMSVLGITASNYLFQTHNPQSSQAQFQKIQSEFQQLGQDLSAGNLTQAQSDFSILSKDVSSRMPGTTLAQAFDTLGTAVQSGNLSAAQQAYAAFKQDVKQAASQGHRHHHSAASSTTSSSFAQALSTLGQALQTGDICAAQAAYTTVQQDLLQFGWNSTATAQPASGSLSVAA